MRLGWSSPYTGSNLVPLLSEATKVCTLDSLSSTQVSITSSPELCQYENTTTHQTGRDGIPRNTMMYLNGSIGTSIAAYQAEHVAACGELGVSPVWEYVPSLDQTMRMPLNMASLGSCDSTSADSVPYQNNTLRAVFGNCLATFNLPPDC